MNALVGVKPVGDAGAEVPAPETLRTPDLGLSSTQKSDDLVYLDPRALTRDCVAHWLEDSLGGSRICPMADPDELEAMHDRRRIRAILLNIGPEPPSAKGTIRLLARVRELLPMTPIALFSDLEDAASIRKAFALGVQGFIPTSLDPPVAVSAVRLVSSGGTFAPAAALLCEHRRHPSTPAVPLAGRLSQRQSQVVACLQRGLANKQIARELDLRESTVKVHLRNIMKKLDAKNRTEVVCRTLDAQITDALL